MTPTTFLVAERLDARAVDSHLDRCARRGRNVGYRNTPPAGRDSSLLLRKEGGDFPFAEHRGLDPCGYNFVTVVCEWDHARKPVFVNGRERDELTVLEELEVS